MNGRVFAVNRSPVLAWNVEPQLQVPYPDMPAAAAAAISPVVPAASDPYGRCWQNQVDAGTSFPYFGLYNNSIPPTSYRLQPGCMGNLGQFWPPTPPPDGCGRFDGSNLYFGPPVLRHGENIPTNLRSSFQGLGHYSHLVETPKEPSQRVFKRETPISPSVSSSSISLSSPVTKSDNLSTYCVVDSKLKTPVSIQSSVPKQEILPVSSGHEPYVYAADARNSSNIHPSTEKSCFSPSYSLKNITFHNSSQDNNTHKANTLSGTQENNCNASPLKNVYFSHFESENVNSVHSKNFSKNNDGHYRFDHKSSLMEGNKSKIQHQSLNGYILHNSYPPKKYDYQGSPEVCNVTANNMVRADRQSDRMMIVSDRYRQKNNCNVKPEKNSHLDCKFQKSSSKSAHLREFRNSDDAFNVPTSVMQPKIEPNDKYFLSSCASAAPSCIANSYTNSGPFLLATDLRTGSGYRSTFTNSCALSKPWPCNELSLASPDSYFKTPEAAKPLLQGTSLSSSALRDGVISVAQTAPQEIDSFRNGKLHQELQPSSLPKKTSSASEMDDEVQIIGIQTKPFSSKSSSRHPQELKTVYQQLKVSEPLCLKTEKESEDMAQLSESTSSSDQIETKVNPQKPEMICLDADNDRSNETELKTPANSAKTKSNCSLNLDENSFPCKKQVEQHAEYKSLTIKKEITDDHEVKTDTVITENLACVSGNQQKQLEGKTKQENSDSDVEADVNNFAFSNSCKKISNETVPTSVYDDENHGLNLLLNTIEKVTLLEASNNQHKEIKIEPLEKMETNDTDFQNFPSACGLDLLSVIAGQRLVAEFEDIKKEPENCDNIKSNYPDVKKEKMSDDESSPKPSETQISSQKSSVFEMQDRLVELQKKYKQKQKELSRLKPKKRLANTYLKGHLRISRDDTDQFSSSNNESASDMNSSTNSETCVDSNAEKTKNVILNEVSIKVEVKSDSDENKPSKRRLPVRKSPVGEVKEETPVKRITRTSLKHSVKRLKCRNLNSSSRSTRSLRKMTRSSKNKLYKLRKIKDSNSNNQCDDVMEICPKEDVDTVKKTTPDSEKSKRVYALRHSSSSNKKRDCLVVTEANITGSNLKTISSKRKSDNPKKFMPSKQSKLSETIIAKHLRSRILFDTSGAVSDDDHLKDGGVPEELYDALIKCHLGDENKKMEISSKVFEKSEEFEVDVLGYPEPSLLKMSHLIEKQRLLALEDGLFYAGCIKEVHVSDRYGIALDGQRGNKLHVFSQEELLTQAIVESKPLSSELPEGTKVCAYWSQQYRCLYPGVIGKAPSPSADWSEPRVFVLFDDGDSGQIPTKNVRLLPLDILPALNEQVASAKSSDVNLKTSMRGKTSRTLRCSTSKGSNIEHCDTGNENESKESSCASINESSCDDSCSIDYSLSPSQNPENLNSLESCACSAVNCSDSGKLKKRQRKRSKRKTSCHIKFKEDSADGKDKCEAKTKRHKKYKDKHRKHHHHHHHHRHNHHHHHHHHSKKRKHRRRNGKNLTQDNENFIPCSADHKTFQSDVEVYTDLVDHSSTLSLPQNDHDRVC